MTMFLQKAFCFKLEFCSSTVTWKIQSAQLLPFQCEQIREAKWSNYGQVFFFFKSFQSEWKLSPSLSWIIYLNLSQQYYPESACCLPICSQYQCCHPRQDPFPPRELQQEYFPRRAAPGATQCCLQWATCFPVPRNGCIFTCQKGNIHWYNQQNHVQIRSQVSTDELMGIVPPKDSKDSLILRSTVSWSSFVIFH